MSEQLPDLYVRSNPMLGLYVSLEETIGSSRYTPHSKLQEAEEVINDLIESQEKCPSCNKFLLNDDRWHEGHHKTYCTLAPYMRKRSTTNE